ncbi:MAG: N-(5-phosphoribosyl)anthranilate isomerase [Firmicutes bacterium]|nr:N-(5-phosphoribosyl)anthranilate isomerase [Bacillota bacterium]
MTKIKICGLTSEADIVAVNEILPDYIGFVFAKSRRQISEETARRLKDHLNPRIQSVGVFVNEKIETVIRLCENNLLDLVQLHGDETEEYILRLKKVISQPVAKAIRVSGPEALIRADDLPCDYLLLDTYHKEQYGGSGICFDWSSIPGLNKPYFLAGGLQRDNVSQAISQLSPFCVDVSSSVETDGVKDRNKIIEFVTKVRSVR